jgi:ABC-type oligopeptide transport system ATPase subunit
LQIVDAHKTFALRGAKSNRLVACDGVTLDVGVGEFVSLVGESGSGKSTLARIAMMLERPDSGSVVFDGVDLIGLSQRALRRLRPQFQMVFQDPRSSLNPRWRVEASIGRSLRLGQPVARRDLSRRIAGLLEQVELPADFARRYPHELSGGQQQRVSIARALATSPKLVVADEPVSGLDVSTQAQILGLMKRLQRELGTSFLFVSHDLRVVRHVSSRTAVMHAGRLVEFRLTDELFSAPEHPYTRELIENVLNAHLGVGTSLEPGQITTTGG